MQVLDYGPFLLSAKHSCWCAVPHAVKLQCTLGISSTCLGKPEVKDLYVCFVYFFDCSFFSWRDGVSHSVKIVCAWLLTNPVYFRDCHDGSFNWTAPLCTVEHWANLISKFLKFIEFLLCIEEMRFFSFTLLWTTQVVRGNSVKAYYFQSFVLKSLPHKHVIFPGGNELNRKKASFNGQMLSGTIEFWSAVSHSQPQEKACLSHHLSRVYLHQASSTFYDLL